MITPAGVAQDIAGPVRRTAAETCTELDCPECSAEAGQPCAIWCFADQAVPGR
jgi:hypothetical protein